MNAFLLGPLDLIVVVSLWGWSLSGREMRSRLTLLLLIVATLTYLIATQLPLAVGILLRTLAIVVPLWLLLLHPARFLAMGPRERDFDLAYGGVLDDLRSLARQRLADRLPPSTFSDSVDDLVLRIQAIPPPDAEWQALQDRTTVCLQEQMDRYRKLTDGGAESPDVRVRASAELAAIEAEYSALRRKAVRPWC